jgi:hypothetical protein
MRRTDPRPHENEDRGVLPLPKEIRSSGSDPNENEKTSEGALPLLPKEDLSRDRELSVAGPFELARSHRIKISVDGDRLIFVGADAPPPADIVALLKRNEANLVALARQFGHDWTAEDWRAFFDERAAIAEHEGGVPPGRAEAQAFECCVIEWLNRNPIVSAPDRCCWCGIPGRPDDPLLPFGVSAHAWMHDHCWEPWRTARRAKAVEALVALQITDPRTPSPCWDHSIQLKEISNQWK